MCCSPLTEKQQNSFLSLTFWVIIPGIGHGRAELMEEVYGVVDAAERGILGTWLHCAVEEMFWFQQVVFSQRETENTLIWGIVCSRHLHNC